jgi:polyisoprenoid-binding protein YceI
MKIVPLFPRRGATGAVAWLCAALVLFVAGCSAPAPTAPAPINTVAPTQPPAASAPTRAPATTIAPNATPAPATEALPKDAVTIVIVPEKSQARYRVREQLVGVNLPNDAVGATRAITGTIVGRPDGTIVSAASKFRVDLRTLKSDRDQRDNFLRRSTLETDRFPFAEFVPVQAPGLPLVVPASGEATFKQ